MEKGRPVERSKYYPVLKKAGIFHFQEALELGVPSAIIARMANNGELIRLSEGIYRYPDFVLDPEEEEFAVVCKRFGPQVAIGGLTALFFYVLIDQVPQQTWIIVPPNKYINDRGIRTIRTKTSLDVGIDKHKWFQITSIERTIVDAFKYATKIGEEIAMTAARRAIKERKTSPEKILRMARAMNMESVILKRWVAITVE